MGEGDEEGKICGTTGEVHRWEGKSQPVAVGETGGLYWEEQKERCCPGRSGQLELELGQSSEWGEGPYKGKVCGIHGRGGCREADAGVLLQNQG